MKKRSRPSASFEKVTQGRNADVKGQPNEIRKMEKENNVDGATIPAPTCRRYSFVSILFKQSKQSLIVLSKAPSHGQPT